MLFFGSVFSSFWNESKHLNVDIDLFLDRMGVGEKLCCILFNGMSSPGIPRVFVSLCGCVWILWDEECTPVSRGLPPHTHTLLSLLRILSSSKAVSLMTHIYTHFLSLSWFLSVLLVMLPLWSHCIFFPPFLWGGSVWLWSTNIMWIVPLMPASLYLTLTSQLVQERSPVLETTSINYNLSSVIFLVYSHFGFSPPPPPPMFLSCVSRLIATIMLVVLACSAHAACCH